MGPTRFPYGEAEGFVNNFNYRGVTAGLIAQAATGFNATLGGLFYTNNTGTTVISNIILDDTANRLVNYEGKVIKLFFIDSATSLANSGTLFLTGTNNLGANGSLDLMFSRGNWYELNRSLVTRNEVVSVLVGTAASVTIDNGTKIVLFRSTSSAAQIQALSGGYVGQVVTILSPAASNSGGITVYVMTGGNFVFPGTNMVAIQTNAGIQFMKVANNDWRYLQPGTAALIN